MEVIIFGDVEWVIAQELATRAGAALSLTVAPFATSTDSNLSGYSITARRVGGITDDVAIANQRISIDCRATTETGAIKLAEATHALGLTIGREGLIRDDVTITGTTDESLPYLNPDPQHPTLHRVSFTLGVTVKGYAL